MQNATSTRGMRRALILIAFSLALPNVAMAQMSSSSTDPVLPDPVPNRGVAYPPSAVTADQAYAGPPKVTPHTQCAPLNPCAAASSDPHRLGPLVNAHD
jgi:hypothetical protein